MYINIKKTKDKLFKVYNYFIKKNFKTSYFVKTNDVPYVQ